MTDILFESDRLYYREPIIDDTQAMQAIKEANWAELQHWMNWASDDQLSMDATKNFIGNIAPAERQKGGQMIFAFHKQTHDLVMVGGLNTTDEPDTYSTGYWGNIAYLGQGYATEKTKATLEYAFNHHGAEKIMISYFEGNDPSLRVIQKCGFEFVETKPKSHQSFATGEMMDEHCFAITKDQWRKRQHAP